MASVLIRTADAVTAELNDPANTWSQEFTAERSYADWDLPLNDQSQRGKLRCDVIPRQGMTCELETRGSVAYVPSVAIVFRKKFEPSDANVDDGKLTLSAVDELVALLEEVNEHFAALEFILVSEEEARWKSSVTDGVILLEHLKIPNQYTGILILNFDVSKAL